jgi:hypothetical protein
MKKVYLLILALVLTGLSFGNTDLTPPVISFTPLTNTSSTIARTLLTIITDETGVPASGLGIPRLYWKKNWTGVWNSTTGVFLGSDQYTFTFGGGVVPCDSIYYYLVAQDMVTPDPNIGANPSAGAAGFSANPPAVSTPPTTLYAYQIICPTPPSIPTLSQWGMIILGFVLLCVGTIFIIRLKKTEISV